MVRVETGGIVLDLFQDESVELELSVNNVRDIGKIYAPISKTFTVPASDRNNQYFKHYYDVNVDGGFNAYVRTPAQLFVDSEQIFAGYLELVDCIIENDEPKQYEILVASAAPSLAKTLEAKKIDALNLPSVTDVPFTISEIAASWIGDSDIRFGLVDRRGLLFGDGSFAALSSGDPVYEADFMPYMRLPTIVKGIIEENGYRYSSTFLDNDIDDVYLMLGRNGGILSDAEVLSSKMIDVSGSTNGTAVNYTFGVLGIDEPRWNQLSFGTEIQDPSSQYNPTTSTFTPSVAGDYKFQISGQASQPTRALDFVMISDAEAATNDPFTSNQVQTSQIFTFGTNNTGAFNFNVELPLLANTAYKFYIRVSTANPASIPITNSQLTIVDVPLNPAGATLDFTSLLPDVTQKQFISEVARLYNLVFVPDRYDDKLIHIQPYDDWIASGSLFNLTEYVDIAKPISVKPTTSIQSRSLAFNMAEGEDELSQKYIKQFGTTHSSVEISDTGNEFAEGETKIESGFVNTLIVRDSTSLIQFPIIADENFESVDIGLRLAFWNGTSPSPTWYFESTLTNTQSVFSPFPQLQPYNDYENPTFNLGFAPPAVASGINIPTDNLFTDYWENYIGNIYDSDSRLVELEAHIPASVLNTLELNDSVIYKNQGYYIQRFTYDTLTERAKIELLKAVRTNPVICNLTPSPTNIIDFRGVVNFVDADGNITQDATENCCNFYGYTWNGKNGKCYLKFDRPPPVSRRNTIRRINDPQPNPLDPTQQGPYVSIYNPVTNRYEYVLPSEFIDEADTLQTVTDRGATTTNEIDIPSVQFDTTQTLTPTSGQLGWNADDETLDLGLNGGGVVHKLGETLFFNVKAAEAISKGNVLYASGAVGNSGKIEASKYIANNTIDENRVLGVAAEDISIGDFGFVYFLGSLRGITTDGSDVGETWVDGTILYASARTVGQLTSVQPVAPDQDIPIAFVTSAHATSGALYIRATQLGYHLGELHDVYVPSPSDGEVLTWSNANQRWEAGAVGGIVTVSPILNGGDTLLWDGENEQGYFDTYTTRQFNYARTGNIANVNLYLYAASDNQMGSGELEADLRFFLPNTMAIRDDNFPPRQPIGTATVSDGRTFMVMRSGAKQVRFYSLDASGEAPLLANDSSFMPSFGGNGYMLLQATYMAETISGTAPTANFTTSQNVLEVTYTSDAEDAYLWDTGKDGTLKTGEDLRAQSIVMVYPSFGTYDTPTLRVANNYGTDSFVSTITLAGALPVASFTISDATPNVGQIVTFTDTSTESPTSWSWAISPSTYVFEGGTSATSQNPQIAFLDESENYTVNLTATNTYGSDSTAFTNNVVSNALEAVHFEYDPYLYGDADNEGTQVPTTYGSPTYNSAGYYAFDGTDDAFYYDYDLGINDAVGAIEVFIDWDNTQNGVAISWARDNSSSYRGAIRIRSSDNSIRFFNRVASSGDQIDLYWNFAGTSGKYHIVINKTADGGTSPSYNYEMYINGVSQGNADTDDSTASQGVWFDDQDGFNPYNITVGGQFANSVTLPNNEIIGDIYRATIYQDALSATRISENYNWLLER